MSHMLAGTASSLPLSIATRAALAGVVGSVVLFGFTPETQLPFYAVMSASILVYTLARGRAIIGSLARYLSSSTMIWRWVFIAWAVASLFWASRANSLDRMVTLLEIHVVGLVLYDAARELRATRWILTCVFVAASVGSAHAIITGIGSGETRLQGMYRNPNLLAVTLVMGLAAFTAGADLGRSRFARVLAHALALVILAGIVSAASLKGVVGVVCVWVIGLMLWRTRRRIVAQLAVAGTAAALAVPAAAAFRVYWERTVYRVAITASAIGSDAGVSNSLVERVRFAKKGLGYIAEAPLRGHGLGAFSWLSGEGTYAHNNAIEVGVSVGVVGLVLYYLLHAVVLYRGMSLRRSDSLGSRFIIIFVPTLLLLDAAAVSYLMKLPTLLLIMCAGWVDARLAARETA